MKVRISYERDLYDPVNDADRGVKTGERVVDIGDEDETNRLGEVIIGLLAGGCRIKGVSVVPDYLTEGK